MQPARENRSLSEDLMVIIPADPVSVRSGLAQVMSLPPLTGLTADDRGTAELVLAEVLDNVVEHAYAEGPGTIAITLSRCPGGTSFVVVDDGLAMPGGHLPAGHLPDFAEADLEGLPEGGFGWHLIRSLTQDLVYQRMDGQNRLSFVLPVSSQGHAALP